MHAKARAWIENGVIRCMSQVCEAGTEPCPRIGFCKVVEVEIREDVVETGYEMMLRSLKETMEFFRAAMWGEKDATPQEKRQT